MPIYNIEYSVATPDRERKNNTYNNILFGQDIRILFRFVPSARSSSKVSQKFKP